MDKKDIKLYYTVAEVAAILNETVATIYYWKKNFNIQHKKSNTTTMRFNVSQIEQFQRIQYLIRTCNYSIKGVKLLLMHTDEEVLNRKAKGVQLLKNAANQINEMIYLLDKQRINETKRKLVDLNLSD